MRIHFQTPHYPTWVVWLIGIPLAVTAILLAVFFFTFFLIVIGLAALFFAARLWWLRRNLRATSSRNVIDGEYVVMKHTRSGSDTDEQK